MGWSMEGVHRVVHGLGISFLNSPQLPHKKVNYMFCLKPSVPPSPQNVKHGKGFPLEKFGRPRQHFQSSACNFQMWVDLP